MKNAKTHSDPNFEKGSAAPGLQLPADAGIDARAMIFTQGPASRPAMRSGPCLCVGSFSRRAPNGGRTAL